jgi:hypothetical protein
MRLLASLAPRLKTLGPGSPDAARLAGIARFVWVNNQRLLDHSIGAVDLLQARGIEVMFLKGVSRIVDGQGAMSARYMRDLDMMVPRSRITEAAIALLEGGWWPVTGQLPGAVRAANFRRLAADPDEARDVDLHRAAFHYGRRGDFDDAMWDFAHEADLRGRRVKVPCASHAFLHSVIHGTVAGPDRSADWVVDAMTARNDPAFDWEVIAADTAKRRTGAALAAPLTYLHHELGLDVPEALWVLVRRHWANPLWRREALAYEKLPENRNYVDMRAISLAESWRSRRRLIDGPAGIRPDKGRPAGDTAGGWHSLANASAELGAVSSGDQLVIESRRRETGDPAPLDIFIGGIWAARIIVRAHHSQNPSVRRFVPVLPPRDYHGRVEVITSERTPMPGIEVRFA